MANDYTKIAWQLQKHGTVQGLMKYINKESLKEQHEKQKRGKATGIDNVTKEEYESNIDENIENLLERMKQFKYRPQSVRRVYIPKPGSTKKRPLGIPAYEDKLVQGVMAEILTQIYEPKFLDMSYGFRPGRSCHDAIDRIDKIIMRHKVEWIVDADIKGFFENVDHKWLVKFLEETIQDKNFIRYIVRFLKSGVMENMTKYETDKGTPQGGLISPILGNVYLHYVLDLWFKEVVQKRCSGEAFMVRYADDYVCCFQKEDEAKKFYEALKKRLNKFGLEVAEEKSKIINFGKRAKNNKESFEFLGIRHINGKNRKGNYKLVHKTSKKKMKEKKKKVKTWIKENRQKPIKIIIKKLNIKLEGHYRYYGISDNMAAMRNFRDYCIWELYRVLKRLGQKHKMTVERYKKILKYNEIARPRIYHSMW